MVFSDVIVVGGGPAGSTCAWKLRQAGLETIILDRRSFPRPKPCAGWITPRVLRALELSEKDPPFGLRPIRRLYFRFPRFTIPLPTRQYAIRRVEFDDWLVKRSAAPLMQHEVRHIRRDGTGYVIDDQYRCRVLVGAGGTACPVYQTFFRDIRPRPDASLITAMEAEFAEEVRDNRPQLWFGEGGLPGYSWYVPKEGGYMNIGIGAYRNGLKAQGMSLRKCWEKLLDRLMKQSLVKNPPPEYFGHTYYLRSGDGPLQKDGCYLLGDAAGLATTDMGEGIGPAVESGILAARSIVSGSDYSVRSIPRRSLSSLVIPSRPVTAKVRKAST